MSEEIIEEIINETNVESETVEEPIKKKRGRPRIPDELKKVYIPHPLPKKEKVVKEPRERKVKPRTEPYEKLPTGRKKGVINNPDRYNEDGSYNSNPLDKEYFKHYYHQVI